MSCCSAHILTGLLHSFQVQNGTRCLPSRQVYFVMNSVPQLRTERREISTAVSQRVTDYGQYRALVLAIFKILVLLPPCWLKALNTKSSQNKLNYSGAVSYTKNLINFSSLWINMFSTMGFALHIFINMVNTRLWIPKALPAYQLKSCILNEDERDGLDMKHAWGSEQKRRNISITSNYTLPVHLLVGWSKN